MSLFESTITGNILNDGGTTEISGITAGQLATVLTAYTPLTDTAANAAAIGTNTAGVAANAAAVASLQAQVAGLPSTPDLAPYALAADLAVAEGSIAANQSSISALNASLATGLASKANQSALDALQLQVDAKSYPNLRGRQAGELQHHLGHELCHHQRQQCHIGHGGQQLRPEDRHRPAGPGPRGQAVGARRGSKNCHGALGPAQHH